MVLAISSSSSHNFNESEFAIARPSSLLWSTQYLAISLEMQLLMDSVATDEFAASSAATAAAAEIAPELNH